MLGGSSARNYFLYQRPTIESLQKWADEVDDQSWTWGNMLPYFKRSVHVEAFPGPGVQTDDEIMEWIGEAMNTVYHVSGTCKMGRRGDGMAVVDGDAKVLGTQNLRVVDASAFPFLVPGHPQSIVYAFAEKIADAIIAGQ